MGNWPALDAANICYVEMRNTTTYSTEQLGVARKQEVRRCSEARVFPPQCLERTGLGCTVSITDQRPGFPVSDWNCPSG